MAALSRKEQKELTRNEIIKSALKVMRDKGIDATQISDITKEAGVAQGTFYVHFKNKDELLNIVLGQFNQRIADIMRETFKNGYDNAIVKIADLYLDQLVENKELLKTFFDKYGFSIPIESISDGMNPPLLEFVSQQLSAVAAQLKRQNFNPDVLSHAILSMWLRVGFRYVLGGQMDKKEAVQMLYRLTRGILNEFLFGLLK